DAAHRHIMRFSVQTRQHAQQINEVCQKCHQDTIRKPHFQASEHNRAGLSCASCHEVHWALNTPYMLRYPGVDGPAGRPLPYKQWQLAARLAAHAAPAAAPAAPSAEPAPRGEAKPDEAKPAEKKPGAAKLR